MEAGEIRFYRCGAAISRRRSGVPIERSSLGQALWSTSLASAIPNLSPVLHADVNSTRATVCSRPRPHYSPTHFAAAAPTCHRTLNSITSSLPRGGAQRLVQPVQSPDGASRRRVCIERAHVPRMFRCSRSLLLLSPRLLSPPEHTARLLQWPFFHAHIHAFSVLFMRNREHVLICG